MLPHKPSLLPVAGVTTSVEPKSAVHPVTLNILPSRISFTGTKQGTVCVIVPASAGHASRYMADSDAEPDSSDGNPRLDRTAVAARLE